MTNYYSEYSFTDNELVKGKEVVYIYLKTT